MESDFASSLIELIAVDSIGSIIIRAVIWLALVSIVAYGTAKGQKISTIRAEAGFFVFFIFLTGLTIYLVFGVIPTISSKPTSQIGIFTLLAGLHGLYPLNKISSGFLQT